MTMQRFTDISKKSKRRIAPIRGYEQMPVVSIDEAIEPLVSYVPDIKHMVARVKQHCMNPANELTCDESASIMLYTVEWTPRKSSFYYILNEALRSEDEDTLSHWFLYLKLLMVSLSKVPSEHRMIYRGVKEDLRDLYVEGSTVIWWGFSSCTTSIKVLQSERYLGKIGSRTMFHIECFTGKDIRRHSFYSTENEILLLAARQFRVIGCYDSGDNFYVVQLKEIESQSLLLEPITENLRTTSKTLINSEVALSDNSKNKLDPAIAQNIDRNDATTQTVTKSCRRPRKTDDLCLIWLDGTINESSEDSQNTIMTLKEVLTSIYLFTTADKFTRFLAKTKNLRILMVVSGSLGKDIVPKIHDNEQLDSIYVFCGNISYSLPWAKKWPKVRGVHDDIRPVADALQQDRERFYQNTITMSFQDIDAEFEYTYYFKDILLDDNDRNNEDTSQSIEDFMVYCFSRPDIPNIDATQLGSDYQQHTSIWWYVNSFLIQSLINQAFLTLDANLILVIRFYILDLQQSIKTRYEEQHSNVRPQFIAYRAQALTMNDFENMTKAKGDLMCFNSFLIASINRDSSITSARASVLNTNRVAVVFCMRINPACCTTSTSFAFLNPKDVGPNDKEKVLISTHSVFRIDEIKPFDSSDIKIWHIALTLIGDNDINLQKRATLIKEKLVNANGLCRLGVLFLKIAEFDQAIQLYERLLKSFTNKKDQATFLHQLGFVYKEKGEYSKALDYYKEAIEIRQKAFFEDQLPLAASYHNVGTVWKRLKQPLKALSFYQKSLDIFRKYLPSNHPNIVKVTKHIDDIKRE